MYYAHSSSKVGKTSGSKGFIETWKLDANLNIKIELVTNLGGKDTFYPIKQHDRFLYVIDGCGDMTLMDQESKLQSETLLKLPSAKQLEINHAQAKVLLISSDTCEEVEFKNKAVIEAEENTALYFLQADGNYKINGKCKPVTSGGVLTLQKGETVTINGSSKLLKMTSK